MVRNTQSRCFGSHKALERPTGVIKGEQRLTRAGAQSWPLCAVCKQLTMLAIAYLKSART
jgi:hypothetical protein